MIKIHNVKMGGFFTLPATADGTGSWSDPADLPSEVSSLGKFTVVKDVHITVKSNTIATEDVYKRQGYSFTMTTVF